ncbi:hypothetical protein [Streptomyces tendae]
MATAGGNGGRVPPSIGQKLAARHGNRITAFTKRQYRGVQQPCPWEFASLAGLVPEERAAIAWIVAEAVMRQRCRKLPHVFALWRAVALGEAALDPRQQRLVKEFASPVFKPQTKPNAKPHHGVPGHVGEWLWYLLALETPDLPGRTTEYLAEPKVNVNDGGGDGLIIRRTRSGSGPELVFRLWEMKKYTGKDDSITATVTGAWQQLSENGAAYVLSQTAWADREFTGDLGAFVSQMVEMWIDGHPSSGAGVSVATNTSAAPTEAFTTSHTHIPHLTHPGALEGLVIAIDNFAEFAEHVQELVWSAL